MKNITKKLSTLMLLLLVSPLAWSQWGPPIFYEEDSTYPTFIAGTVGDVQTIVQLSSTDFLYGLAFGEDGDRPCYLETYWWSVSRFGVAEDRVDDSIRDVPNVPDAASVYESSDSATIRAAIRFATPIAGRMV